MADIFQANGSPEDQAKLLAPIQKIFFPWALLQPELLRSSVGHIQLEFADLSHFAAAIDIHGEREDHIVDDDGNAGHIMYAEHLPDEFRAAVVGSVAGLAWYGKIQVEQAYRDHLAMIQFVIGAECAHEADYFYINVHGMRPALAQLVHPTGPDSHGWFEGSYFDQIGESWMSGFSIAYSDAQPDTRFVHVFTREMIPQIHAILHAERTDKEPDPPPDPNHYSFLGRVAKVKSGKLLITPDSLPADIRSRRVSGVTIEDDVLSFGGKVKTSSEDLVVIKGEFEASLEMKRVQVQTV